MTRTTAISLQDRIDEIHDEELPQLEAQRAHLYEKAEQQAGADNEYWKVDDDLRTEYEGVNDDIDDATGEAENLETYRDEYASEDGDDAVWTIRELPAGTFNEIGDEVAAQSDVQMNPHSEQVSANPKEHYGRQRTLEESIVDSPPNAPSQPTGDPDVSAYPSMLQSFLFDCADEFNATGSVDLGNSSLAADLMNSDG